MRNLKRALSLALASVMVMGLAVVGSNASYVDVTSKQNQEAIEVLQKVGIMVGDENGKFNPEAKVTRNEMAVIMANLMDYRVSTYKGTSPFTDVPEWAEPYVAACYTNGIVSGYDAKTYGGNDSVATSQAALMLMKALGYFQFQSDFEDDWQLSTVKQGNKIELFEDVASGVKEAMTRNDVAQLVLNALKSGMVEASDDTIKVNTGDVKVEAGKVNYNYVTSNKEYAHAISWLRPSSSTNATAGYIVELGEKLYNGDLKMDEDSGDDFQAPANRWTYKNTEIGTYAKTPDYTFSGIVKSNDFYNAVGKTALNDYTWEVYVDGGIEKGSEKHAAGYNTYKADGAVKATYTSDDFKNAVKLNNKSDLDATVRGSNTYVYLNDDVIPHTATVIVKNTYIGEITKVKDGTITVDDMGKNALDFDTTGYAEGDMILYNKTTSTDGTKDEIQEILGKAELKEGKVETIRDKDRIVIDGTTYKYADRFNASVDSDKLDTDSVDQTVSFYLDGQGNIIAFEDAAVSQDYAFVYSVGSASSQNDDKDTDIGAKLVLTDGTVKNVVIDNDDIKTAAQKTNKTGVAAAKAYFGWSIVSYSQNDDGKYSLTLKDNTALTAISGDGDEIIKSGTARLKVNGNNVAYADKNTVYLINEHTDDGDDFNVYVGYNNVPSVNGITSGKLMGGVSDQSGSYADGDKYKENNTTVTASSTTGYTAYVKDGVAKVIVVTDAEVKGSSNDVVFVVGNETAKRNKSGSTEYYVYDAVVNGEVTSLKVKAESKAHDFMKTIKDDKAGKTVAVFFGMTKNSNGYVTNFTTALPTDVEVNKMTKTNQNGAIATATVANEYVGTKRESNGGNVTFNTAVKNGSISMAANDKALIVYYDGEDLSVVSRINTDSDDAATVVTDDGTVTAILVREMDGTTLSHG